MKEKTGEQKSEFRAKRDEYILEMKEKIDKINTEIAELESRAQDAKETVRKKLEPRIEELQERASEGQIKLRELGKATDKSWEGIKASADTLWKNIGRTIEETKRAFQESRKG